MDQRNLFLAIAISAVIYIGFYFLYEKPRLEQMQAQQQAAQEAQQAQQAQQQQQQQQPTPGTAAPGTLPGTAATAAPALVDRDAALKQSPRVVIDSPRLKGSIALKGGRLDDVVLADYRETVDPNSPNIVLLSPAAAANAYFAEFGWVGQGTTLPHDTTVWQADGDKLTPDKPLTLASYESALVVKAYVETVAVGDALPAMPLVLEPDGAVELPLEATYAAAFALVPRRWQRVLE